MTANAKDWTGQSVRLRVRVRPETAGCTRSVPASCWGGWALVDSRGSKAIHTVLTGSYEGAPIECRSGGASSAPGAAGVGSSGMRCHPALDPTATYVIEGTLTFDGEFTLAPSAITPQ